MELRRPIFPLRVPAGTRKSILVELTTVKTLTRTLPTTINCVPLRAPPVIVTVSPDNPLVAEIELMTGFVAVSTNWAVPEVELSNLRKPTSIEEPMTAW